MKRLSPPEKAAAIRSILAIVNKIQEQHPRTSAQDVIHTVQLAMQKQLRILRAKPAGSLTAQERKRLVTLRNATIVMAREQTRTTHKEVQLELPIPAPSSPNVATYEMQPTAERIEPRTENHPKRQSRLRISDGNFLVILFSLFGCAGMVIAGLIAPGAIYATGILAVLCLMMWLHGSLNFHPRQLEQVATFVCAFILPLIGIVLLFAARGKWAGVFFFLTLYIAVLLSGACGYLLAKRQGWDEVATAICFGYLGLFVCGAPLAVYFLP